VTDARRAKKGQLVAHWNPVRRDWGTRIELPANPGEPRARKWVRAKTEQECLAKARQAMGLLTDNVPLPDDSKTLGTVARQWLASMESRVTEASWAAYRTRVNLHILPLLGTRRLTALTTEDVDQWQRDLEAKGLGGVTRSEIRSTLVQIIDWAMGRDLVGRNVARLSKGPGGSGQQVESLTRSQAREVLEAVSGWRYEACGILMLMVGLRVGEALGIRWADVDLEAGKLTVQGTLVTKPSLHWQPSPKTSSSRRTVDLPQRATEALTVRKAEQERERQALGLEPAAYVFLTESQILVDPSRLAAGLKCRTADLGVKVNPHKLRHTAASLMVDQKVPLETVSKILGHKSIRTTADMYHHLLEGGRAAAASAMNGVFD
jgi:integrase